VIEGMWDAREALRRRGVLCPWVFHRNGRPIKSFARAWRTACRLAEYPGRIPHDFRRTAVRNLTRAGVPEAIAMKITGHKNRERVPALQHHERGGSRGGRAQAASADGDNYWDNFQNRRGRATGAFGEVCGRKGVSWWP
jgi:integrase